MALINSIKNPDLEYFYKRRKETHNKKIQKIISEIGDPAVKPLITALTDISPLIRCFAAETLCNISGKFSVGPILAAVKEYIENTLDDDDFYTTVRCFLGCIGKFTLEPLFSYLMDKNPKIRICAVQALGNSGSEGPVNSLISMLKDVDKEVRKTTILVLSGLGNTRLINPILSMLQDVEEDVRKTTIIVLSKLGNSCPIDPLLTLLKDVDKDVRLTTVMLLKELRDTRAINGLIESLKDPVWMVRGRAAYALGNFNDERIVEALLPLLNDEDPFVIGSAAAVLGKLRSIKAVEPLISALKYRKKDDKNYDYVANALNKISGLGFSYDTERWEKWWEEYKLKDVHLRK